MYKTLLLLTVLTAALPAQADTLNMTSDPVTSAYAAPVSASVAVPSRGQSMAAVTRSFGEPNHRHRAVGGGKPQHPPITRWDYSGFTVVFERSKVIDVVVASAPAPLTQVDELTPAP